MKRVLIIFLALSFFGISSFSDSTIIAECEKVSKNIKKESLKEVNFLLIRATSELNKKFDQKLLVALVELLKKSYQVDANYYSIEFIHPFYEKNKELFLKEAKKSFSKKNYERLIENIALYENEQKVGNDPK